MKTKKLLLAVVFGSFLFSCSNNEQFEFDNGSNEQDQMALTVSETLSLNEGRGEEVPEADVIKIAQEYIEDINENSLSAKKASGFVTRATKTTPKMSISKKYYLNDTQEATRGLSSNVKATVYDVDVTNEDGTKGLVVVGGDDRYPKVIAYIPRFEMSEKNAHLKTTSRLKNSQENLMLGLSKAVYRKKIVQISDAQAKKTETLEKIAKGLNISSTDVDSDALNEYISKYGIVESSIENDMTDEMTRSSSMPEPGSKVIRSYGRPCGVLWDQWEPYNLMYDEDWVDIFFGSCSYTHHPAGCAVVAIAQIMAALEPAGMKCCGQNIDWAYLKEKEIINSGPFGEIDEQRKINMVAALFRDIYNKTKSYPTWGTGDSDEWPPQKVNCVTQTGTNSSNVYDYFKNLSTVTVINYNTSGVIKWDPEVIRQSLQYSFPVFVGGNGHAFVLDEFLCCIKSLTRTLIKQYDVYFHANFGWGADDAATGYYLVQDTVNGTITFETSQGNYVDSEMSILPFIGKKTL